MCVCVYVYVCICVCNSMFVDLHLGRQIFRVSSTILRLGCLSLIFSRFTSLIPFLRTIELPFVVITFSYPQRYANSYVQLLTTSRVFFSNVQSYVMQEQGIATRCYKCQGIDGYFFFIYCYRDSRNRKYLHIPPRGWLFSLVFIVNIFASFHSDATLNMSCLLSLFAPWLMRTVI